MFVYQRGKLQCLRLLIKAKANVDHQSMLGFGLESAILYATNITGHYSGYLFFVYIFSNYFLLALLIVAKLSNREDFVVRIDAFKK